jgi:hypothetical protein
LRNNVLTTGELLEVIRLSLYEGYSQKKIAEKFGVGKSTIGDFLRKETYKGFWEEHNERPHLSGVVKNTLENRKIFNGKRFVITSAQNNTYVHDKFYKSLLNYCELNDAQLLVSTFIYDRKGWHNEGKSADKHNKDYWYDPKIEPHRCDEPVQLAKGLVFCGELNILPTDVNPLGGFYNYLGNESGIIPHAKIQMQSLPSRKNDPARLMYTTGALTLRNYIQKKTGQKAEWHHCFGAVVVEIDEDGDWFVRQLHAEQDTGGFFDLDCLYTPEEGLYSGLNLAAINYGDIHAAKMDDQVANICWKGENSILDILKPDYQFVHDVLDQQARNHHNVKDPHFLFKMYKNKTESVREEIILTTRVIQDMQRDFSQVMVVDSNHDKALEKWLKEQDYRKDPVNALFFLELQLALYKSLESGEDFHTFEYAAKTLNPCLEDVIFLREDESFEHVGVEFGQHGHLGANGSRGNTQQYTRLGCKYNIGHQHSAAIKDGVYVAGICSKLDQGYNVGGSSWSHSLILTYRNGKRAIVTLKNGKWRG